MGDDKTTEKKNLEPRDPRPEAGVLAAGELSSEQRQAGDQLARLIKGMVDSNEKVEPPKPAFLPRIDKKRSNRVLLIDGGRGSGKTALLVTLLEVWRQKLLESKPAKQGADEKESEKLPTDWGDEQGRIVPVGLLDLHPLPPSTNLLFHIVGRFERVVEWLEGDGKCEQEPAAWHFQGSGELDSRKKWQRLLRAVAAGWDGNVKERGAKLDLEAYAVELEEAERQRLNLVDTFADFVNALAEDFAKRRQPYQEKPPKPLFVMAVDDADMDPSRSVELLDTVRMLWHPRVAFVLTGDSELFLQTLTEHCLGELRRPLIGHHLSEREVATLADRRPVTRLAADVYEKVIPPQHRCIIPPIPAENRLTDDRVKLRDALALIDTLAGKDFTLATYFEHEPQLCDALPDRLRGLLDLRDRVKTLANEGGTTTPAVQGRASAIVEAIWSSALLGLRGPSDYYDQGAIRGEGDKCALQIRLARRPPGSELTRTVEIARYEAEGSGLIVNFGAISRLDATVDVGQGPSASQLLPRSVTAAFMLAANVACDQEDSSWDDVGAGSTAVERVFACSEYQLSNEPSPTIFPWPLPVGFSLPSYAAVSFRWKRKLNSLKGRRGTPLKPSKKQFVELVQYFISLIIYIWQQAAGFEIEEETPTWETLAGWVKRLLHEGSAPWYNWAKKSAGLLAAPEYGLPPDEARKWLMALEAAIGRSRWPSIMTALRVERRRIIDQQAAGAFEEIDAAFKGHPWGSEPKAAAPSALSPPAAAPSQAQATSMESPLRDFKAALSSIGVVEPLTASASEALSSLEPKNLKTLTESLAPFKDKTAMRPQALARLWATATHVMSIDDAAGLVQVQNKRLTLERVKSQVQATEAATLRGSNAQAAAKLFALHRLSSSWHGRPIPGALQTLYELIWDVAIREPWDKSIYSPSKRWWPGLQISVPSAASPVNVRWPSYQWPTYGHTYRIMDLWNSLTTEAHFLSLDSVDGASGQDYIDAIALWLIDLSFDAGLQVNGIRPPKLNPNAKIEDWNLALGAVNKNIADHKAPPWTAPTSAWANSIVLFAAPESGLSIEAASAVMQATTSGLTSDVTAMRVERFQAAGLGLEEAHQLLQKIDEAAKKAGHPWAKDSRLRYTKAKAPPAKRRVATRKSGR